MTSEQKQLLENWRIEGLLNFSDESIAIIDIHVARLLEAARAEQREQDTKYLELLLEKNLKTEEYFGVYGEVNNKQFIEDFKNS